MPVIAAYMVPHPPMIVPEVGRGSEEQVKATTAAYKKVAEDIANLKPETIIISSPHATMYADYFHISPGRGAAGSFAQFHAGQVRFREEYDEELVKAIERLAKENGFPAGTQGQREPALDHGTMVPLYFVRQFYSDFKLIRVGLSGLPLEDHYRLGQLIRQAVEETGRRAVYIASGDLSHKLQAYGPYGFSPEGPQYDERVMDVCGRAAFGELFDFSESFCEHAAECGHRSFLMMAGALDGVAVEAERLSHEDVTGVGYGICTFHPMGTDGSRRFLAIRQKREEQRLSEQHQNCDPWVRLAWQSVESFVLHRRVMAVPDGLPDALFHRRAGAFVSIHKQGRLRGCIGTISPTRDSLAEEIIRNAVSAAVHDPRFDPIRADELPWLEINVDVLGEPEEIQSESELDVKRYGVIVSKGSRRGLLLPDLEGVDTVEQQVAIAKQKAGIGAKEKVSLQRFEVVRHT
ncbi:MAG: AmmeMemoRadiSam system protein A [Clostridia bacterium]|nr:AmmeMemoRadiSam system protein A [Clostridia bacterium]